MDVAPTLSDLLIEPNPNMTISCYVSWTTDVPSDSEVQFGASDYEFRIRDEAAVTDHRVLVIGMYADTEYRIRAVSTNPAGSGSLAGEFTTGSLPQYLAEATLTVSNLAESQVGWTLTNLQVGRQHPAIIVMYDEHAIPVWYFIHGDSLDARGDISTMMVGDHVLIGAAAREPPREVDLGGNILWEGPDQPIIDTLSHHMGKLPNGNYLFLRDLPRLGEGVSDNSIEEVTPALDRIWRWNLLDHVVPPPSASGDWCHGNSVTVDEQADVVYLSCRFQGIFKAERYGDQAVIWQMGASIDDANSGDMTFIPPASRFSDLHDPEIHDDGTILVYDNGGYAPRTGEVGVEYHSRVLEYAVDEDAKTATLVWEFPGSFDVDPWYREQWYSAMWGDADRLANGNVLIDAGVRTLTEHTRIFEVRREDGQVVWEMTLPTNIGSYRAERLSPPPLVERIP